MRRFLVLLALLMVATSASAQVGVCSEIVTLRNKTCPAGTDCANKASTLTWAELDNDLANIAELCLQSGADQITLVEIDDGGSTPVAGDVLVVAVGAATIDYITQNAGTDITTDLEEEAHCSEHDSADVDCSGETIVLAANSVDTGKIVDDTITEADLDVIVDTPNDEECLTYEADAGGDFEWQTCGAGGGGDSIEIEDGDDAGTFTAIDTTARFEDQGDINFAVSDGGAGGPDSVTATVRANSVALATDTTGSYVEQVADGTGIDGSVNAEQGTYTPTLDLTEVNNVTFGDNSNATVTHTVDPTGATNPVWSYTDGNVDLSTGNLQEGGVDVSVGAHFTPNADPGVDHSSYVAGHGDGANCTTSGEWPAGVDGSGAVQGCASVLPASASPTTDGQIAWDSTAESLKVGDDGVATLEFVSGAHTTDTGPSPDCSGTSTYQDGEGGCDAVGGDASGGLDALQVDDVQSATTNTEAADNNTTQVASTAFVQQELSNDATFALLAGRSGGQTLIGGTGAGDDLTLQTTSNASKGSYILTELDCSAGDQYITSDASGVLACGTDNSGGGATIVVEEGDSTVEAAATNLDFGLGFDVTSSPAGEANVVLDYTEDNPILATETTGDFVQNITAGAGLASTGATSGENIAHTLSTASTEAAFLADGGVTSLTCGASNQGKAQVMDNGTFQFCDGATTSVLRVGVNLAGTQTITGAKTFSGTSLTVGATGWTNANHAHAAADSGGQIAISNTTGTLAVARGGTGVITSTGTGNTVLSASPALTGDPTVPTAIADDNDTSAASTAFVQQEINGAGGTDLTCSGGVCNVDNPVANANQLDSLDSTAFAILAGQAGGQVLIGGTGAGDDLTLQTTSNASKGSYILTELDCSAGDQYITSNASGVLSCGTDNSGGGATITVEEDDATVDGAATNIDFGLGFDVTSSPAGEANVVLDYTEDNPILATETTGDFVQNLTAGAGLSSTGATSGENIAHTLSTASTEAAFLADGGVTSLTCGAGQEGKMQVMDTAGRIQFCDGQATSALADGYLDADGTDDTGTDTLDDLSDDLPTALSNVTTMTNAQLCEGNAGGGFDCDIATITDAQTPDTHTHTDATITEADLASEDYGDFTCGAGADDCVLDAGVVDSTAIAADTITASDVAASLDTRKCFHFVAESIATTDEWVIRLPPFTGTMTRFDCESYSGTSFTVDICDGEDIGDDTCTTSILGAPLACGTSGANDTTLSATGFAARDKVSIVITAQTGDPTGDFYMTCTVD